MGMGMGTGRDGTGMDGLGCDLIEAGWSDFGEVGDDLGVG